MKKEEFDAALGAVEPLARDAADPQMRANAQSLAGAIRNYREQVARLKAARDEAGGAGAEVAVAEGPPRLVKREDLDEEPERRPGDRGKSPDQLAEEAMMEAIRGALRRPEAGEARALGLLTHIECDAKGVTFVVRAGARALRLTSRDFNDLRLMAFTPEAGDSLTCGPRRKATPVVVTYRAAAAVARARTDGAAVALEFVPANFKLEP